jgi:plasmid stabilization system protein ParE
MACYRCLETAFEYIRADSPRYAQRFALAVLSRVRWLRANADIGAVVTEFSEDHFREVLVRRYRLIFERREHEVVLLGQIHGARDLGALWQRANRPR